MAKILEKANLAQGTALTKSGSYAILKRVHPDMSVTSDAAQYMINLVTQVDRQISAAVGKTYIDKVKAVLPGELALHAEREINKALGKFNTANVGEGKIELDEKQSTYLQASAMAEYLTAEIFELAGNKARDEKRLRITPLTINVAIRQDSELYTLFKTVMPPDPLIYANMPLEGLSEFTRRKSPATKAAVKRDLQAMFLGRKISPELTSIVYNMVRFLQLLFGQVSDERFALWLDEIPVPDKTPNLNERCYRKVMGLIVAGLMKYAPQGILQYTHLVYAVMANDYYDLTPYLRVDKLQ